VTIIDSQVHAYEANTSKRPWHSVPNWPAHVTGDEMVAAMDKVGVDGAIFISAFSLYRYDASYAVVVQRAHPGRFAIIKPVDPDDPAVGDVIADWKRTPGAVAVRIMLTKEANREPTDPGLDRIARAAAQHDLPVNVLFWGNVDAGTMLIDRHPRPSGDPAAAHAASPAAAVGRPAEGAGAGQAKERGDQGERRLHAVAETVSVSGHLGSTGARVGCLGPRTLPVGHGLDSRVRCRQL
jgi:predicted TIM-barrel fold metal-dependent hydrolase